MLCVLIHSQASNMPSVLKVNMTPAIPIWEPHQFVAESIMLQGDVGDVQTSVSILIAMGEARKLLQIEDSLVVSMPLKSMWDCLTNKT